MKKDTSALAERFIQQLEREVEEKRQALKKVSQELAAVKSALEEIEPQVTVDIDTVIPVTRRERLSPEEHASERERIRQQALKMQEEFSIRGLTDILYDGPVSQTIYVKIYNTLNTLTRQGKLQRRVSREKASGGKRCYYRRR